MRHRAGRVEPQSSTDAQSQYLERTSFTFKEVALNFRLGHEIFIYAIIICGLYRLINEELWKFQDTFAKISFGMFAFSITMDGWQTKFQYIFLVIRSLHYNVQLQDNWKAKLKSICYLHYWLCHM